MHSRTTRLVLSLSRLTTYYHLSRTAQQQRAAAACRADGSVSLKILDTGRGIAPEHLPHIFERIYKADQSRSNSGTGLGLAIARHIVQAHSGTITAESRLGEGATFTVLLPALIGIERDRASPPVA